MPLTPQLTTEKVRSLFNNNFKLTNYAIRLAHFYVNSGLEVNASALIKEVTKHPDEAYLNTLKKLEEEEKSEREKEEFFP